MSQKAYKDQQECLTSVSSKRAPQERQPRVSTRAPHKSVALECLRGASQRVKVRHTKGKKIVLQENLMKALHKSVSERHVSRGLTGANVFQKSKSKTLTVSFKSVAQACLTRILLQWCLKAPPKKNVSEKRLQKVSDTSGFQECLSGAL